MRDIQHHTDIARNTVAGDIVAAIPADGGELSAPASKINGLAAAVGLAIHLAVLVGALKFGWSTVWIFGVQFLIAIGNRAAIRMIDSSSDNSVHEVLFVVRPDRVDIFSGTARKPKGLITSHPLTSVRLHRPENSMTAQIAVDDSTWSIRSWHEKQSLRILGPLGADLSGMPSTATSSLDAYAKERTPDPHKEIDQ